jgi:hypothetical protein
LTLPAPTRTSSKPVGRDNTPFSVVNFPNHAPN